MSSMPVTSSGRHIFHDANVVALRKNIAQLEAKKLVRSAQHVKLQLANELIEQEAWDEALHVLRPLWLGMSYRHEGWWDIVEEIGWATRMVAEEVGDGSTVVAVTWELMNRVFTPRDDRRPDVLRSLDGLQAVALKPTVVIRDRDLLSFLNATFAFEFAEGKAGESCTSQLMVTSNAIPSAAAVAVTEIQILFEGGMRPIILAHKAGIKDDESHSGDTSYTRVSLHDAPATTDEQSRPRESRHAALHGEAELIFPPGVSTVFEFKNSLREAGEAKAVSATFRMASESFDLEYVVHFDRTSVADVWWCQRLARKRMIRADPHGILVLPKPPKMDLRFTTLQEQYYTNESIKLQLDIRNGEEDESIAKLVVRIAGSQAPLFTLRSAQFAEDDLGPESAEAGSSYLELGSIPVSASTSATLEIPPTAAPSMFDVTVELSYYLVSDMETPISKITTIRLMVVSPFEANYDFSPRLDATPWPSYFTHDEKSAGDDENLENARGLPQEWRLTTRYASFATETLEIEDISLEVLSLNGGIACATRTGSLTDISTNITIQPKTIQQHQILVQTRKLSLDDRRSASLDLNLVISWRRRSSPDATKPEGHHKSKINITKLPIPRLLVAGSEPRVLASVAYPRTTNKPPIPLLHVTFTIENPSLHFLSFSITTSTLSSPSTLTAAASSPLSALRSSSRNTSRAASPAPSIAAAQNSEPSFAFSGPKQCTVQLLPLSRRDLKVLVLPNVTNAWIRMGFRVQDRYFQKVLKVLPGGDGVKGLGSGAGGEGGVEIWVPPARMEE